MAAGKLSAKNRIRIAGALVVAAGLLFNKWILAYLFSPDRHIEVQAYVLTIYAVQLFLIGFGALLLVRPRLFDEVVGWLWTSSPQDGHRASSAALVCVTLLVLFLGLAPSGTIRLATAAAYQYPLLLYCLLFVLTAACVRLLRARFMTNLNPGGWIHRKTLLRYISIACVVVYIGWCGVYTLSPVYSGHLEPHVASVASAFVQGQPLYHELDSGWRYSMLYGPVTYLVPAFLFRVAGPGILAARLGGALAGLGGLIAAYLVFRRAAGRSAATMWLAFLTALLLSFGRCSFWSRADSYLFFCSTIALSAIVLRSWIWPGLVCGLMLGIAVNLKVHAVFYIAPLLAVLIRRHGYRVLLVSGGAGIVTGLLPFLLPGVSFTSMVAWLRVASGHGLQLATLLPSIQWVVFLAVALVVILSVQALACDVRWIERVKRNGLVLCVTGLSVLAVAAVAAKLGAGPHHFLPFLPLGVFALARGWQSASSGVHAGAGRLRSFPLILGTAFGLSVLVLSSSLLRLNMEHLVREHSLARAVISDLQEISTAYPNARISMGVGDGERYERTYYRPALVFAGNPYPLDAAALMDMHAAGVRIPDETLALLRSGQIEVWLIPKGADPFALRDLYTGTPLFDDAFRQSFHQSYRLMAQSRFFDLWFFAGGLSAASGKPTRATGRKCYAASGHWRLWFSG